MERLKIQLPDSQAHFKCELQIRVTDLNYGNHLGNDKLISLLHEARCLFLKHLKQSELHFFGSSLILSDLRCQYLSQGFLHDQLEVELFVQKIHPKAFSLYYSVKKTQGEKLAKAVTTMCCFNYEKNKIEPVPDDFWDSLVSLEAT